MYQILFEGREYSLDSLLLLIESNLDDLGPTNLDFPHKFKVLKHGKQYQPIYNVKDGFCIPHDHMSGSTVINGIIAIHWDNQEYEGDHVLFETLVSETVSANVVWLSNLTCFTLYGLPAAAWSNNELLYGGKTLYKEAIRGWGRLRTGFLSFLVPFTLCNCIALLILVACCLWR